MLRPWGLCCLLSSTLVLLSANASAQRIGTTEVVLASSGEKQAISLFSGDGLTMNGDRATLDYATFVYELFAFVTKEVLSDAGDEYPESPIGSRLSRSMPELRSEFASHCLTVVTQLGSVVPYLSARTELGGGSASPLDYLAHAAAAALALRKMWSAVENDAGNNRRGVSLNPKVGTNKVGVSLTFHW